VSLPAHRSAGAPRAPDPYKGMISLAADRVNLGRDRKNDPAYFPFTIYFNVVPISFL